MKEKLKYIIFGNGKEIEKKCVFWNMLFSILFSLQSAIMLLIVTRINGTEDAGILSIAFAAAYLMFTIGVYGVRNFQVTDFKKNYYYDDYRKMRLLSCGFMVIFSFGYCIWKSYESYKMTVVLSVCFLKLLEAIEDLYHGELQRAGRLDIAGRSGAIRLIINYFIFIIILLLKKNLLLAMDIVIISSFIIIVFTRILVDSLLIRKNKSREEKGKLMKLAKACFPLFITSFLSIYIGNSPKYAIDAYLTESEQAYYAIISMPVFTINLLSGIIYRPNLVYMAKLWNEEKIEKFKKVLLKQSRNIAIIAIMILGFGISIGLKMLEILYGVSLATLKYEFAILLIGGGMAAAYNFLTVCITIMRKQSFLIVLSVFIMIVAFAISNSMVYYAGLMGASCLYLILMTCEMLVVFIVLWIHLKKINNYDKAV